MDSQKQTRYLCRKKVLAILTFRVSLFASGRRRTKRFKACSCCFLVGRSASEAQEPQYFKIVICPLQKAWFQSENLLQNAECIHMANCHSTTKDWQILAFWYSFPNVLLGFSCCMTQQSSGSIFQMPCDSLFCNVTRRNSQFLLFWACAPAYERAYSILLSQFLWLPEQLHSLPSHPHRINTTCCWIRQVSSNISSSCCNGKPVGIKPRAEKLNTYLQQWALYQSWQAIVKQECCWFCLLPNCSVVHHSPKMQGECSPALLHLLQELLCSGTAEQQKAPTLTFVACDTFPPVML